MNTTTEPIHIAFICDENYVLPTSVTINSILQNKFPSSAYRIHIVTTALSEKSKKLFNKLNSDYVNISIVEAELGNLETLHQSTKNSYCVATPAALLKFRLPELLGDVSKVLYLDGDLIVRRDLSELFQTDLTDYFLGAVIDSGSLYSENPIVKSFDNYFNSGVMFLNLDKMREYHCTDRLIEEKVKHPTGLMDQNIFNIVFNNQVRFLNIRYNCLFINLVRASQKFTMDDLNARYNENFVSLKELGEAAYIIHYSSKDKPWKYYDVPFANEWYLYFLQMCSSYNLDSQQVVRSSSALAKNDYLFRDKLRPNVIISLTSYPARINTVHIPIQEMLQQTVKADHIILWLASEQFPNKENDLPQALIELTEKGLEIRWCEEDLKSHKKYYYAMQEYPNDIIITIDDDLHYSPYLVETLLNSYKDYPRAVSAMRVHLMLKDKNKPEKIAPYAFWKKEYSKWLHIPSLQLFATSGAGTLFPPYCMSKVLFDKDIIKNICLYADDIWFKVAQVMCNTPVVLANSDQRLRYIENTQEIGLWNDNVTNRGNDKQLEELLELYNQFDDISEDTITSRIFSAAPYPNRNYRYQTKYNSAYARNLENELLAIKNSTSYKIGRFITFIPRKIRGGYRCYQDHGLVYTVERSFVDLGKGAGKLCAFFIWLYKKIRGGVQCCKDHGAKYTVRLAIKKAIRFVTH